MHQVMHRFCHKGDLPEWLGEQVALVPADATGRSDGAHIGQKLMLGVFGDRKDFHALPVGRHVSSGIRDCQVRITLQVAGSDDFMKQVMGIAVQDLVSPGIKCHPKLGFARHGLQLVSVRAEAHVTPVGIAGQAHLRLIGKDDLVPFSPKLIRKKLGGNSALMGQVDPVVQPEDRRVEVVLRVGAGEAGQHLFFDISFAISVAVFQVPYIRRIRHDDTLFPAGNARRENEAFGKKGRFVR